MDTLDSSSYRRPDVVLPPIASSSTPAHNRRATVGSPPASYPYSNTFETPRPHSRNGRLAFDPPYRSRRSTVCGHSQGHNVNAAPPVNPRGSANMMWSDSASSSPVLAHADFLPEESSATSSSCGSPRIPQPTFQYEHLAFSQTFQSPMNASFALCPGSPDFSHMGQPRSMPMPLLSAGFTSGVGSSSRHSTSCNSGSSTTPALSPTASSTSFTLDTTVGPPNSPSPRHMSGLPSSSQPQESEDVDSELKRLRDRVRDLEFINDLVRLRVAELETDNKTRVQNELGLHFTPEAHPPQTTPYQPSSANVSPEFSFLSQDIGAPPVDWQNRTAARLKRFCGLNRAGNALCAWHDSRRERRAYPPRMAPLNTLNCGCTYAEALFEESLARNGVGAFYPGENVRMDPALRNPLLKLLEERYGYRDGDFERTADGGWQDGEDAQSWEHKATGKATMRQRS